jgi:hypothetical protein
VVLVLLGVVLLLGSLRSLLVLLVWEIACTIPHSSLRADRLSCTRWLPTDGVQGHIICCTTCTQVCTHVVGATCDAIS